MNGSNERKISPEFTLSVESANFSKNFNYVYDHDHGHGAVLCKTGEFFDYKSKYFVNGEITIKIKGILKAKRPSTPIISAPISMEWKIKEYDLKVEMEESDNGHVFSETVVVSTFPEVSYYLSFIPKRIKDEKSMTKVSLHVESENEEKIETVYDFCIDSVNYRDGCREIFEPETVGCGFVVCSTADLFDPSKKFMVDGVLTINLNGILMVERDQLFTLKVFKTFALKSALKRYDKNFMIVVGNKNIQVHKQVLIDASHVWAEMLKFEMTEAIENKTVIQDFPFKIVDISIKLLYGRSILLKNSLEDMLLLYKFGHKFRIKIIMDLIEEHLIKEISSANVVNLLKFSSPDALNVIKLHQKCINYFIKCLKQTTPIYAAESLGEAFLASMVLKSLHSNFNDTNV
uniref:BTB domain-containing protein n=1 Tax=Panagrolaimus davidi TaxID=227884 RepID=A0A914PMW0_9BILA